MKIGIIGGGILGLSLAHYLQKKGHVIHIYEKNPFLGGLACSYDYRHFIWDKFYHVILPQDTHLLELLKEISLENELRWRNTGTGYFADGKFYSLSNSREMLQFPLLSWAAKVRMGLATLYTLRLAQAGPLYQETAKQWLIKVFGRSNYEIFWKPLLRAKFGEYADRIAAVFIWAAIKRLFGARTAVANKESMGYIHGGYHRILKTFRERLEALGGCIHLGATIHQIGLASEFSLAPEWQPVASYAMAGSYDQPGSEWRQGLLLKEQSRRGRLEQCVIEFSNHEYGREIELYDKVIFTAPKQTAKSILSPSLGQILENEPELDGAPTNYLGVVCMAVVLRRPLTPYYILNIADESIPLTGVIEMTGLIDAAEETAGLSLVYLPRYVDSRDPFLRADDGVVYEELFENGLKRLFPALTNNDVVSWHIQRAQHVQPVPLVLENVRSFQNAIPGTNRPFIFANTSLLACPTLNNNEVVGLAKEIASRF